ncbi:hypothetical protein EVAR_29827_1 [Eumeta japonica]|uniref:Reverse transcriptase domain-containing protein n=1 Tax=Eumeta variegata TaxID=151549 RepID=A0A4C1VUM8_EUMVA|nr:hypothetical protein EVAR_29827_1 [Eumeta japonica]
MGLLELNINGSRLNYLRFADDLVILEENPKIMESMVKNLADEGREIGLEMNSDKTQEYFRQEHAKVLYYNSKYITDVVVFTGRQRRGQPYLTNATGVLQQPWGNNVTILKILFLIESYITYSNIAHMLLWCICVVMWQSHSVANLVTKMGRIQCEIPHTQTQYKSQVAAFADVFRSVSESSGRLTPSIK